MQNVQDEYVGAGFQPVDQDEGGPGRASVARKAFLVVLAILVGAMLCMGVVRMATEGGASAAAAGSAVASSTPAGVVAPAVSTPVVSPKPATAGNTTAHVSDTHAPDTPRLLSPPDGAIVSENGAKVTLEWSKVTDPSGVRYRVQIQQWLGGGAGWGDIKLVKGLKSRHYHHTVGAVRERWRIIAVDLVGNKSAPSEWRTIVPTVAGGGDNIGQPTFTLEDTVWDLNTISDGAGGMLDPVQGTSPKITFQPDGKAGGSTGLNAFWTTFAKSGNDLHVGQINETMMAGLPDVMKQEKYFEDALTNTVTYSIEANFLKLRGPGGAELAVFQAES